MIAISVIFVPNVLYRAVGVVLDRIGEQTSEQLSLYSDAQISEKNDRLAKCFDKLESRFGKNIVKTGFYSHNK